MMNRLLFKRVFPQILFFAELVVLCGAIALAQDQAPVVTAPPQVAPQRTDGQIEMDVVHGLDASPELKNDLITAATIEGEVTLSGTVSSQASSDKAASIAGQVAGVTKVNNNLKIGNPQEAQGDNGVPPMAGGEQDTGPGPQGYSQQGPPPDQGQEPYPQQQPQYQQPQYRNQRPPAYAVATGPVTVGPGTLIQLRTSEPVNSKRAKDGQPVQFTVIQDVAVGNVLAIPRGATVHGVVTEAKKAGDLGGSPVLALTLTSLDLGGQSYPLQSDQFKVKGPNKAGHTVGNAFGGAVLGTIIGCAAGRGFGCAVGAGAGAAAGTAASAATPGPGIWIPAEARVDFHLVSPVTVAPVSAQEAARLAQGLYAGGPNLYRRGYYPVRRPYYGYPYGYPPPPVYYRPY
ncbi:MAG: BON domain-containing protein [Terracidiphilus sp.]|jgi:hypothetical protein